MMRGSWPPGNRPSELFGQAAAALQLALEVSTREQHPEAWAASAANLSRVLVDQASSRRAPRGTSCWRARPTR